MSDFLQFQQRDMPQDTPQHNNPQAQKEISFASESSKYARMHRDVNSDGCFLFALSCWSSIVDPRSILASPRRTEIISTLTLRIRGQDFASKLLRLSGRVLRGA